MTKLELTFAAKKSYFKVFGSSDGVSYTELAVVNADNAGSIYSGSIATVEVAGKAVRYVKIVFTGREDGSTFISLYNVVISGVSVEKPAATTQPAETKKATITGYELTGTFTKESTPANSFDGNAGTKWSPETDSNYSGQPGIIYTLDNAYDLVKLELDCSAGKKLFVTILGSTDGKNYIALGAVGASNMADAYGDDNIAAINVAAKGIRYIKVIFNGRDGGGQWVHLNEISVFGKA